MAAEGTPDHGTPPGETPEPARAEAAVRRSAAGTDTPGAAPGGTGPYAPDDGRPPYALLPRSVRTAAAWSAAVILFITVAVLFVFAVVELRAATVPLILALLGTALLYPVMPWLARRGLGRSGAAALTCVVLVLAVGAALALLVNSLSHSAAQIGAALQDAGSRLADWLGPSGQKIEQALKSAPGEGSSLVSSLAGGLLSGLGVAVQLLTGAILSLALVFFFLRDGHRAGDSIRSFLPADRAETVIACGQEAFAATAGFMRGTTVIALIDAFFITVGLVILGVPGAPGLGALVFMGAYIPYVGAFLSGTVAVLVALADGGVATALWALGVVLAVQALEGYILQPLIQSRTVQLHPATIMVVVIAGGGVAGVIGALLAVPISAAVLGIISVLRGTGGPATGRLATGGPGTGGPGNGGPGNGRADAGGRDNGGVGSGGSGSGRSGESGTGDRA
ncbi:AI-2E family transporter [Kitasatospora sp. NBC_00240]|uniref:AI-2E family transporter n=1 Tax=Kitasatospora sp. NBC_00240 TaxID=2903567 RepID=UPI00224FCF4E|nr:AI-2E family transporter [Kitasatospora sp. NBC_00240]MCX5208667.1 AI-2E family transporter [Kitasatospora sp. NBC_00240]